MAALFLSLLNYNWGPCRSVWYVCCVCTAVRPSGPCSVGCLVVASAAASYFFLISETKTVYKVALQSLDNNSVLTCVVVRAIMIM